MRVDVRRQRSDRARRPLSRGPAQPRLL